MGQFQAQEVLDSGLGEAVEEAGAVREPPLVVAQDQAVELWEGA